MGCRVTELDCRRGQGELRTTRFPVTNNITDNNFRQLLDALEDEVRLGGCIIDWHACDLFPKSWIDLVIVLRTDSTKLYDRLTARRYPERKLQENMDAEIMEVLLDEARTSYDEEIIIELQSNETEDIENNVERAERWLKNWERDCVSKALD